MNEIFDKDGKCQVGAHKGTHHKLIPLGWKEWAEDNIKGFKDSLEIASTAEPERRFRNTDAISLSAEKIKKRPIEITKNEEGRLVNNARDGVWVFYHENGKKKAEGRYVNGSKVGLWTSWYSDGKIEDVGIYTPGEIYNYSIKKYQLEKKDDHWVRYFPNGAKCEEGLYDKGLKNGSWTRWHVNGETNEIGSYQAGRLIGQWCRWYPCGRLKEKGEFGGIPESNLFHESLVPVERWKFPDWDWDMKWRGDINYSLGKKYPESEAVIKNGKWKYYYSNGQVKCDIDYVDGYRNGLWQSWHANGCKEKEGEYVMGNAIGIWKVWYDNGQIHYENNYDIEDFEPTYDRYHSQAMDRSIGLYTSWFKNGQKRIEINFVREKCESSGRMRSEYGAYVEWEEDGSLKAPKNETSNDAKKSPLKTLLRFFKI